MKYIFLNIYNFSFINENYFPESTATKVIMDCFVQFPVHIPHTEKRVEAVVTALNNFVVMLMGVHLPVNTSMLYDYLS